MKSKLNFSGQMSLFDLFQNDAVPIEELQEKSVTNQHNLDEVADIIDSAAKDESVQRSVLKEDMLAIGDIIWSCYGDYEGTRDAKAYIITDETYEKDESAPKGPYSLAVSVEEKYENID